MGVCELGASGSAMMRVYLVVVGSRRWRLEERDVVAIKILREKCEKVFTKVGLGCEAERRCIDGLCCFFFQISVHVYVRLGNKDGKRDWTYQE